MSPEAQNQLYNQSIASLKGQGVPLDEACAFSLNAEAAREGHADAVLAMGWFHLGGIGISRDVQKARDWYRKSARRGEPRAMFSLGYMAFRDHDWADALQWFKRASDAGHKRSLYWLGKLHWRGHGVPRDQKRAMRLFHQAATHKEEEAQRAIRFLTRE